MSDKKLKRAKTAVRKELRKVRDAIPEALRLEKAAKINVRLAEVLQGRSLVMVFISFDSEVPTQGLIVELSQAGYRLALPRLENGEVEPAEYAAGEPLTARTYGLLEPETVRLLDPGSLDAIVTPGLGFDRMGRRIGYGAGYYDRLFRRVREDALKVGIGFDEQVIEHVPSDRGDELLDLIVTDSQTIACRSND